MFILLEKQYFILVQAQNNQLIEWNFNFTLHFLGHGDQISENVIMK